MENLAIIPARSGSKGLPDKNIIDYKGKPLLAHSIEAAIKSGCFSEVMVSTDSERYAEIARLYGANVPFLRSKATATDSASSWDMVEEVLQKYESRGKCFDTICLLQPTSPLRDAEDVKNAYHLFVEKANFAVVSVCEVDHSPLWCGQLPISGEMDGFIQRESMVRRQDAGTYYRLNGALYIVDVKRFREDRFFYQKGSFAYIMPRERSVDIDTEMDLRIAEAMSEF